MRKSFVAFQHPASVCVCVPLPSVAAAADAEASLQKSSPAAAGGVQEQRREKKGLACLFRSVVFQSGVKVWASSKKMFFC